MNIKAKALIKNFSYTITANLISLIISILVILIMPKLIGVEEYGYWQLYLFYASYVGFLQFGWNDGIYLRYGGAEYSLLDKRLFFSQYWTLVGSQVIIAVILVFLTYIFTNDASRQFVLLMVAIVLVILGSKAMLSFILLATNRIIEYSKITMVDRIIYCCLVVFLLLIGKTDYRLLIFTDLVGKFISLVIAMYYCKDIVFRKLSTLYINIREIYNNVNAGIKLMFANIASMLIIGVVRLGIELSWDISTFGKVSLTLNISNFVMIFINALGTILYPLLRRTKESNITNIYVVIRELLLVVLLALLLVYYPLNAILTAWLPQYSDSLKYMALLLPMCIYEGKTALLTNTYLKTLRKEKIMLRINVISLLLSVIITLITTVVIHDLNFTIASVVFLLAFRSIISEIFLSRMLSFPIFRDILLEVMMTVYFICISWFINSWLSVILYLMAYLIYVFIKRKNIVNALKSIKYIIQH